ncbi:MAG: Uma2 family endonuclease [Microcoleus sp. PH2017_29_MFU_D_A]|jgi:Uma2 family endonuclease|uniref:Uma2 family endonuclease n=1 Tax=unclassified Microcoleus TaxID=2642155 RepID=UPI001D6CAB1D|nr:MULTISPECIES: Uma2 family endonuclease [unclassified Microcoleus]MCC3421242.1 Uma2 family endonuclease [Microcoleus sp. PH2017_07_MST_O_A]MCC3433758.1 Uma2 family endonuclease [Microcoleus sp. PH2017_04_SCI_O_A]MCC3442825.1 Uma2 family endonuclease [Microcoleus sp. PH2017_03_ELD_O_A]MCC3465952.1 Uma2 family endonuclease [Microcoleus sp. PH2017_06_SFM_O_A]MCC3503996.1 Uma2 family endonuclease [Microcoleus sp. PH2017_19_SFW_U_A]TAE14144.1 MAG: Uma2 family endonuclease [Oscillatoriales cyanob
MTATLIQNQTSGILLNNISWKTYESLLNELGEHGGIRLTYDRGTLEIMTPLAPHEGSKKILGRFVESVSEELNIEIRSLGSLTCRREDLARGLEPDQCYYIQNENVVWDKEQIDLNQDPPPDLVVEIDVTSSSIDRLSLYASLGVPEVWRYDGNRLIIYQLEAQEYVERDVSPTFPFLSQVEMLRFLELRRTTKENALLRLFREWVRSQIQSGE